jgi:hypothetical protein
VPEFTVSEAEQQLRKAATYFSTVLDTQGKQFLACKLNGVTMVVAVEGAGEILRRALVEDELLGANTKVSEPPVVLIPRYHMPSGEFAHKTGHVHLHVLNDAKIGRRVRKSGECLCGKKRGQNERSPEEAASKLGTPFSEANLCGECRRVAEGAGLTWPSWDLP